MGKRMAGFSLRDDAEHDFRFSYAQTLQELAKTSLRLEEVKSDRAAELVTGCKKKAETET